jgi:hypothetical protein
MGAEREMTVDFDRDRFTEMVGRQDRITVNWEGGKQDFLKATPAREVASDMLPICKEVRETCEALRQLAQAAGTRYDTAMLRDCVRRLDWIIAKAEDG